MTSASIIPALVARQTYEAGTYISNDTIDKLNGDTTKDDVEDKNGPPNFRCFRSNGHNICYFYQKKNKEEPEQQRYVEFQFNESGKLREVSVYEPQ
jgi:outer membrane protein assembly factor BamE (lipoprotein component of BamABCDE complex)